jgi:hypothetical protein
MPSFSPWLEPPLAQWALLLLDSFRRWTGRELVSRDGTEAEQAQRLFVAPIVVVSHGTEEDPILNYGNRMALELWEMSWQRLTQTPSRLTAEPVNQAERAGMLARARERGYIDNYRGVRITATGRRFLVEQAIVWNVVDGSRGRIGQAATFSQWTWL